MDFREGDAIRDVAKATMDSAVASAEWGEVGSQPVYGNRSGIGILARLDELDKRLEDQQREINSLKETSNGFLTVRARFFGTFERDIIKQWPHGTAPMDHFVYEGNRAAHEGDIRTDVVVYLNGIRQDDGLFQKVYGVETSLAKTFGEFIISYPRVLRISVQ